MKKTKKSIEVIHVPLCVDFLEYFVSQGYEGKELVKQFAEQYGQIMRGLDKKIRDREEAEKCGEDSGWFECDRAEDLWADEGD
jgi:hypothetical protein